MKSKRKSKSKRLYVYLNVVFILGLIGGVAIPGLSFSIMNSSMGSSSCAGVNEYYTGESFSDDAYRFIRKSGYVGGSEPGFLVISPAMAGSVGWDCEDISHGIMCIAELYEVDCKYYGSVNYEGVFSYEGHLGIKCEMNGEYVVLY